MLDLLALLSFGPGGWGDEILKGALLTIELALVTLPVGLAIGLVVALAKDSPSWLIRGIGNIFTTVFRGLPGLWVYGGIAVFAALYVMLFGVSAAAYRTLYASR